MKKPTAPGKYWKADDTARRQAILRSLQGGGKGFNRLFEELRWGKTTLSLYLKALERGHLITSAKERKRKVYLLNADSPKVKKMLGNIPPPPLVDAATVGEEKFMAAWTQFTFHLLATIMEDCLDLAREEDPRKASPELMEAHIADLNLSIRSLGGTLGMAIKQGRMNPQKVRDAAFKIESKLLKLLRSLGLGSTGEADKHSHPKARSNP